MIEKKIHYCWFGGNELPTKAKSITASFLMIFHSVLMISRLNTELTTIGV